MMKIYCESAPAWIDQLGDVKDFPAPLKEDADRQLIVLRPVSRGTIMTEIDLNARGLQDEHNVFVIRPGNGYNLLAEITQQNVLLFELPGAGPMEIMPPKSYMDTRNGENNARQLWDILGRICLE